MNLEHVESVEDNGNHFVVTHRKHGRFTVAKKGLDAETLDGIQSFAHGGKKSVKQIADEVDGTSISDPVFLAENRYLPLPSREETEPAMDAANKRFIRGQKWLDQIAGAEAAGPPTPDDQQAIMSGADGIAQPNESLPPTTGEPNQSVMPSGAELQSRMPPQAPADAAPQSQYPQYPDSLPVYPPQTPNDWNLTRSPMDAPIVSDAPPYVPTSPPPRAPPVAPEQPPATPPPAESGVSLPSGMWNLSDATPVKPEDDPELAALRASYAAEQKALADQGKSANDLALAQKAIADEQAKEAQNRAVQFHDEYSQWKSAADKMQSDLLDPKNNIDPRRLWNSKSTADKAMSVIGMVLGGIGAGLSGGPNIVMQMVNDQIKDDIEAQRADVGRRQTVYSHMLEQGHNVIDAYRMAEAFGQQKFAAMLGRAAANEGSPQALATAARVQEELKQRSIANAQSAIWGKIKNQDTHSTAQSEMELRHAESMKAYAQAAADGNKKDPKAIPPDVAALRNKLVTGDPGLRGTVLDDPSVLNMLGKDDIKRVVKVGPKVYAFATTDTDKKAVDEGLVQYKRGMDLLAKMRAFHEENPNGGVPFSGEPQKAESYESQALLSLYHTAKLGKLTDADIKLLKQQVANISSRLNIGVDEKLDLMESLLKETRRHLLDANLEGSGSMPSEGR